MQYLGVIGGSGLYVMKAFDLKQKLTVATPFGVPSGPLCVGSLNGVNVVFLARHGEGHVLNPSEINFRANIWALKNCGVKAIFSLLMFSCAARWSGVVALSCRTAMRTFLPSSFSRVWFFVRVVEQFASCHDHYQQ